MKGNSQPLDRSADPAGKTRNRTLLFISPVIPAMTGNGLAMRAAQTLLAFSTRFAVTLLVVPRYGLSAKMTVSATIQSICSDFFVAPALDFGSERRRTETRVFKDKLDGQVFDVVHVFRLLTVDHAATWIPAHARSLWLDLDEVESASNRAMAKLAHDAGEYDRARNYESIAADMEQREIEAFQRFDRVFVTSQRERERIPGLRDTAITILPNVLPFPESILPFRIEAPFVFLFVGTLSYFPNWEGLMWFTREIWPQLLQRANYRIEFHIVGIGASEIYDRMTEVPGVRLIGEIDHIADAYRIASAVVVPLRAGGGTRIKVIESFGFGRPVISTSIGAEGIDYVRSKDLLIADGAAEFVDACLAILASESLRADLISNGRDLANRLYTPARLAQIIAEL